MITERYYDSYWEGEEGWFPFAVSSQKLSKIFEEFVTDETIVLDIGCGDGEHYGKWLCKRAKQYYGLDVSIIALRQARANGISALMASTNLPFFDNHIDVVLCIEVLEHLFDPAATLRECHRVIKSGGSLIISVPNIAYFRERIFFLFGRFSPGGSPSTSFTSPWIDPHIRFYTRKSISDLLLESNFKIETFCGDGLNIFNDLPLLHRLTGREVATKLSRPFRFLQNIKPSVFSSKFLIIASPIK